MPREYQNLNPIEHFLNDESLSNVDDEEFLDDNSTWENAFADIGIDPSELPPLKLTRQHGRIFDHSQEFFEEIDL